MSVLANCALVCIVCAHLPAEVPLDTLLPYNLVQAEVKSIEFFDVAGYRASSEVTHVYKGDPGLLGHEFTIQSNTYGASTQGSPSFMPPLKVGDVVIWYLLRNGNTLEHVPAGVRMCVDPMNADATVHLGIIKLPARKGDNRDKYWPFHVAEEWAKSVEAVAKAPPEKRYAMLKELALSPSRPIAVWAMVALAHADPKDGRAFLRELIGREDLSLSQRLTADEALAAVEWKLAAVKETGWRQSPERLRAFQKWVNGRLSAGDAHLLIDALATMLQGRPFPPQSVSALVEQVLANRALPSKDAIHLLEYVGRCSHEASTRQAGFNMLLRLFRQTNDAAQKLETARVIRCYQAEARAHRAEIASLLQLPVVGDANVAKAIMETLKRILRGEDDGKE